MICLRLPAALAALLISTGVWADLNTYEIDPQYREEIYSALKQILDPNGVSPGSYGRVELLPSGQLLVNAPAETLAQVEQVLQAIRSRSAPAAPRVALRYWGVLGARAADAVGSPPPAMLNDVLGELRRLHGELTFRVIGTAAVVTNSGQYGEVHGTTLSVEQTAHVQGDTLNAEISMELSGRASTDSPNVTVFGQSAVRLGGLNLRTTLERGDFVVLGENHVQAGVIDGPVFYIVHWEE